MSGSSQTNENLPGARGADADAGGGQQLSTAEIEALARRDGWRPKAEFRGKGDWVDAAEYMRRSQEHLPIIKGQLKRALADGEAARAETAAIRSEQAAMATQLANANQAVNDIREMLTSAESRGYKRALDEAGKKLDTAIADGDLDGARAARKELEQVTEEARQRAEKAATTKKSADDATSPRIHPDAKAWVDNPDNAWYHKLPAANKWANAMYDDPSLATMSVANRLAEIARQAADVFGPKNPDLFKTTAGADNVEEDVVEEEALPPARRTAAVGQPRGTGGGNRQGGEPTFEDLPPEAKAAYEREAAAIAEHAKSKKTNAKYTKDEYLRDFKAAGGFDQKS